MTFNAAQARNNHGEFGTTDVALKGPQLPVSASAIVTQRPINTAAHKGADTPEQAQAQAVLVANGAKPLDGLPQKPIALEGQWYVPGPIGRLRDAASEYMKSAGLPYSPPTDYAKLDKVRAAKIADEYDKMKNDPNDPRVKASYDALVRETLAQWDTIKKTGLKVEWVKPGQKDPYALSPRLAAMDVSENNHWWGFPTDLGYGSGVGESNKSAATNPMLRPTGEVIDGRKVVANDVFRIVHDMMGHLKEGNGFRGEGEENAWRSHATMYSDLARPAMTAETRGQNSWVNYGPHGVTNRTADAEHTIFAPQKIGLMPDWTSQEGAAHPGKVNTDAGSGTPAQDLLASHFSGKETMADVEAKLTPSQLDKVRSAEAGMKGAKTTQQQFQRPDGTYDPERAKVHAAILDKLFSPEAVSRAIPSPGEKPTLTLTGGRPAAGKTSTLEGELKDVKGRAITLNADDIQKDLPGFDGAKAGLFNGEAQDIALQAENIAREHHLNIIYDATMKSQQPATERVRQYKQGGYDVNGYFVHTSPVTSAIRTAQRFESEGRFVPPSISFNSRTNEKTFDTLIPEFKKWAVYDNNGDKPKLHAHGENK